MHDTYALFARNESCGFLLHFDHLPLLALSVTHSTDQVWTYADANIQPCTADTILFVGVAKSLYGTTLPEIFSGRSV